MRLQSVLTPDNIILDAKNNMVDSNRIQMVAFALCLIGAAVFHYLEPALSDPVDAFYLSVMTLTTIGYGDFTPVETNLFFFTGKGASHMEGRTAAKNVEGCCPLFAILTLTTRFKP